MQAERKASSEAERKPLSQGERKPLYWHDPMYPQHKFDKPGKSPFMDMELVPVYEDSGGSGEISIDPRMQQSLGEAAREASVHSGFWLLTAGFFVCGFQVTFVAVHLPAFIADKGLPAWLGAASLSLIGLFNIAGTLLAGWLGGRYRKKYVLALLYLLRSLALVLFLVAPVSEASVLVFGAALGFLWLGTVPLTSGLVAQIFGPAYMSMLYGFVFLSHQIGSFLGCSTVLLAGARRLRGSGRVHAVDPFDALVQTAANLQASRLVTGVSARMPSEELARRIGLAWEKCTIIDVETQRPNIDDVVADIYERWLRGETGLRLSRLR